MDWSILLIGLTAQGFYTARVLVQWFQSEKSKRIESPLLYWVFSLIGSVFLFLYGYLREDFSIIFGELLSFYIYIWNLRMKGFGGRWNNLLIGLLSALPIILIIVFIVRDIDLFTETFFRKENLPIVLLLWGVIGQAIYKMRFVYQWYYSYKHHESLLPVNFWWIALVGSLMIIVYGIYRQDIVLIIGQVGIIATIRNIMIGKKGKI